MIIEHYRESALAGDRESAKLLLAAIQPKAAGDGNDAPTEHRVGVEANLALLFGNGGPDDLPVELQRQLVDHYRVPRAAA
jgi:hypothetical protein